MPLTIKPRNPVALSPLLRKGGVHCKSNSAIRQSRRVSLAQDLDDWRDELEFEREVGLSVNEKSDSRDRNE